VAAQRLATFGQPILENRRYVAGRLRPLDRLLDIIASQISTSDGGASGRILKIDSGRAVWCLSSRSDIDPSGNGGLPVSKK